MLDVFSNASTIPLHLTTTEFYTLLSSKLTRTGLFIGNVIADPTLGDNYSVRMNHTIRSAFSRCMTDLVQPYSQNEANLLYFCRKAENEGDYPVVTPYSDDSLDAGIDSYIASLKHRNRGYKN